MLESAIEKKVCAYGTKTGWLVRKLQWIGRHGAPDRLFMMAGFVLFIEFKQRGKKPTEHQRIEHERLRAAGMIVHIVDDVDNGKALLDRLRPGRRNARCSDDLV